MKRTALVCIAALTATLGAGPSALAQATNPYLGQLMLVGFGFCPKGWANADGQILPISQNTALFSLLGTTYGGNGKSTFALPDLRGRVAMHTGTGTGLPDSPQGEVQGEPTTTLTIDQMPMHNHVLKASTTAPDTPFPGHALLGSFKEGTNMYVAKGPPDQDMRPTAIGQTGGNKPFDQHQPSLTLRYCISLGGTFPPKN